MISATHTVEAIRPASRAAIGKGVPLSRLSTPRSRARASPSGMFTYAVTAAPYTAIVGA